MKQKLTHNQTLIEALKALLPDSSNNTLRQFIRDGRISVDGIVLDRLDNTPLTTGQEISFSERKVKYDSQLKIIFEDEHLVVIEKPPGLLSVGTAYETKETAHGILKERYKEKVYVIHRLDLETSGLLVFARTQSAFHGLKEDLFHRRVKREYIAVVEGTLEGKGTWQCYLQEDKAYNVHVVDDPKQGELAITHYEVLAQKRGFTTIRCRLETGKKHQIRIHAMTAGQPVVGDMRYGSKSNRLERMGLHAERLSFTHPITKKQLSFTSASPF